MENKKQFKPKRKGDKKKINKNEVKNKEVGLNSKLLDSREVNKEKEINEISEDKRINKEEVINEINKNEDKEVSKEKVIIENKDKDTKKPVQKKGRPNIAMLKKIAEEKRLLDQKLKQQKQLSDEKHKEELKRRELEKQKQKEKQKKEKELEEQKLRKDLQKLKINRYIRRPDNKKIEIKKKEVHDVSGNLKSPICCILGHVDTGKTKLLDKLRESNVQGSEAGGITQQIGATYFPIQSLKLKCDIGKTDLPGILIIDTPGHESFTNLRSRGSSLCDLAILVVDILHLIEKQTLESINLLKMRKTPFIIALNKIDRLYQWKPSKLPIKESVKSQNIQAISDFKKRVDECILKFAEIGLNVRLFYENPDEKKFISMVPTSAITGEGLSDLLTLIIKYSEIFMTKKVIYKDELVCTVLEVKEESGFGSTIDVILKNGKLRESDKICLCGTNGPIVTTIRNLLIPQPLKELRIKSQYISQTEVKASLGVKIVANGLENVIAGSKLIHYKEGIEDEVMEDMKSIFDLIKLEPVGLHVQASTLGSLEALIQFIKSKEIPISSVGVGHLTKKDITKISVMNEKAPEYSTVLCFDIKIDKEIEEYAVLKRVKIFNYKIIYNLIDAFEKYYLDLKEKEKKKLENEIIFPFRAKIIPNFVFTTRTPFIFGIEILRGKLKLNTPVFVEKNGEIMKLGRITSIENNRKNVEIANSGDKVSVKIESDSIKMYGRHFDHKNLIESFITRNSIDLLKKYFKEELSDDEWRLVIEIKRKLGII